MNIEIKNEQPTPLPILAPNQFENINKIPSLHINQPFKKDGISSFEQAVNHLNYFINSSNQNTAILFGEYHTIHGKTSSESIYNVLKSLKEKNNNQWPKNITKKFYFETDVAFDKSYQVFYEKIDNENYSDEQLLNMLSNIFKTIKSDEDFYRGYFNRLIGPPFSSGFTNIIEVNLETIALLKFLKKENFVIQMIDKTDLLDNKARDEFMTSGTGFYLLGAAHIDPTENAFSYEPQNKRFQFDVKQGQSVANLLKKSKIPSISIELLQDNLKESILSTAKPNKFYIKMKQKEYIPKYENLYDNEQL